MKQILYTLVAILLVAFTGSCSKDDTNKSIIDKGSAQYKGTMKILKGTENTYTDASADVTSIFDAKSSTLTLVLKGVKFDANMPMTLDITLSNVPYQINNNLVTFSIESAIPTVAGKPYPQFTFTNLAGKLNDSKLEYSANCMGYKIEYAGEIL